MDQVIGVATNSEVALLQLLCGCALRNTQFPSNFLYQPTLECVVVCLTERSYIRILRRR